MFFIIILDVEVELIDMKLIVLFCDVLFNVVIGVCGIF